MQKVIQGRQSNTYFYSGFPAVGLIVLSQNFICLDQPFDSDTPIGFDGGAVVGVFIGRTFTGEQTTLTQAYISWPIFFFHWRKG